MTCGTKLADESPSRDRATEPAPEALGELTSILDLPSAFRTMNSFWRAGFREICFSPATRESENSTERPQEDSRSAIILLPLLPHPPYPEIEMRSIGFRLLGTWLMVTVLLLGHCVDCLKMKQAAEHSCCHKKPVPADEQQKPACPIDQVLVQEAVKIIKADLATGPLLTQDIAAISPLTDHSPLIDTTFSPPADRPILHSILRI